MQVALLQCALPVAVIVTKINGVSDNFFYLLLDSVILLLNLLFLLHRKTLALCWMR